MNILHVTLGNPKHHRGGLNRYCVDLMAEQKRKGHLVSVLYAGTYTYSNKTKIKRMGTAEYAVNGALPVAIIYGIDDPMRYMKKTSEKVYRNWLIENKPDIIHVHSLMGIHEEFFMAAEQLRIPMIFTTHDYYACCFRCNLFNRDEQLCDGEFNAIQCQSCNAGAGLSRKSQMLLQAEWYQMIKNWSVMKFLKKKKASMNKESKVLKDEDTNNLYGAEAFEKLYEYYYRIMKRMEVIHCNSEIAKTFYKKHYPRLTYEVLPISHKEIVCQKHIRKDCKKLHISYFGGMYVHKGYYQLKDAVLRLAEETTDEWDISLYGSEYTDVYEDSRVRVKGIFTKMDEENVWENTDLLVFTSQWPETFGFGVLEALARGIPVICSDLVGANFLLGELIEECTYQHDNTVELKMCMESFLNPEYYALIQEKIVHLELPVDMGEHTGKILELYMR